MPYLYLSIPTAHADRRVTEYRMEMASYAAAFLKKRYGRVVLCPSLHAELIHQHAKLPDTWAEWKNEHISMLEHATELCVLKISGWNTSRRVMEEMEAAETLGIPISYIEETDKGLTYVKEKP
ncbi:MAG: hypothetical protein KatS3mg104_2986 [Phycisphaerae bacterium]|nr:MAG: hypothetical protein KatS3mg104_2986 [Phycisphaerae bacterium]